MNVVLDFIKTYSENRTKQINLSQFYYKIKKRHEDVAKLNSRFKSFSRSSRAKKLEIEEGFSEWKEEVLNEFIPLGLTETKFHKLNKIEANDTSDIEYFINQLTREIKAIMKKENDNWIYNIVRFDFAGVQLTVLEILIFGLSVLITLIWIFKGI
ncbi:hypothetical protein GFV16_00105 [Bacillus megaterium]|uniref:hypothetical protein n=1 Tax=Priestia megaterium TaxID=1404 RepID=UPI001292F594|nr:hypothetical protein [Priestia megaterium]MQR84346.1 hypothetical protein [Priestia megaterium]